MPRTLEADAPKFRRRRSVLAYLVLGQLLYGRHSSVRWLGPRRGVVTTNAFATTLVLKNTTVLRAYLDWLYRNRYLTSLEHRYGEAEFELAEPPVRAATPAEET